MINAKEARDRATIFYKMIKSVQNDAQILEIEAAVLRALKDGQSNVRLTYEVFPAVKSKLEELGYVVERPTYTVKTEQSPQQQLPSGAALAMQQMQAQNLWNLGGLSVRLKYQEPETQPSLEAAVMWVISWEEKKDETPYEAKK